MFEKDQPPFGGQWGVELCDLVPSWLIPVEVVLTVEARFWSGYAVEGEDGTEGREEDGGVEDRL